MRSGLASFSLRSGDLQPLTIFHRKILRGILSLSKIATIPAIHFLLGDFPIEAQIHRDIFSLFFSVWRNPNFKIYDIVKYLLENSPKNSRTWSMHIQNLSQKYDLEDPLSCMKSDPPEKSIYKEYIHTKISAYYEKSLRTSAENNSKMTYLNVSLAGLRGRHHPALSGLLTTKEVKSARIHLKMLSGDYFTYSVRATQSGGSPHCRCCLNPTPQNEDILHILVICDAYTDIRKRMIPEYQELCSQSKSKIEFEEICKQDKILCQFILDPASFNLKRRIHLSDPILGRIFQLSRDYCNAINTARMSVIRTKEKK